MSVTTTTFLENKYRRWYDEIVNSARARALNANGERHHVLPRSLGGARGEVVALTFREHFVAHWLLTKFTTGAALLKMKRALWAMSWSFRTHTRVVSGRQHALARRALPELGRALGASGKGRPKNEEHRRNIAEALRGKVKSESHRAKLRAYKPSEEQRRQLSARFKERTYSAATLARMRAANIGRPHTEEARAKIGAALRGRVFTDEWRAKISAKVKGRKLGPHSPEHRAKLGEASRTRARDASGRWAGSR